MIRIRDLGFYYREGEFRLTMPEFTVARTERNVAASAKLFHYTEITAENLGSFHFHGDLSVCPITAVIAVPHDTKSGTILRGRHLSKEETIQIVKPEEVIDDPLQNIFRIKNALDAIISVVALATTLALILVFALSLRLRKRAIQTIFKIGCSRMTIARLLKAEISLILLMSGVSCVALIFLVDWFSNDLVRALFIR